MIRLLRNNLDGESETESGVKVTHKELSLSAAWHVVSIISQDAARLPLYL